MSRQDNSGNVSRRSVLLGGVCLSAGAALGVPALARAAGNDIRRFEGQSITVWSSGGAFMEALQEAVWKPFTEQTGILINPMSISATSLIASMVAGRNDVDVFASQTVSNLTQIKRIAGLLNLREQKYRWATLDDLLQPPRLGELEDHVLPSCVFAYAMGYRTDTYGGKYPEDWAAFWDTDAFPGSRMLQGPEHNRPDLEFALLAKGVSKDELYPIDLDLAFESLKEISPSIKTYWTSGAISTQMLADGQVTLGSVSTSRLQSMIDGGAPVGINWNQHERVFGYTAIPEKSPKAEIAHMYLDYMLSKEAQIALGTAYTGLGLGSLSAAKAMPQELSLKTPTHPEIYEKGFDPDEHWWSDNASVVLDRWQRFAIGQ